MSESKIPETREEVEAAFKNQQTVRIANGTFAFWMNPETGQISGTCSEGTCDFEYDNFDDFMSGHALSKMRIDP